MLILFFLLILRALLVLKGAMSVHIKKERNLSIVIPLKGWDQSLPSLVQGLLDQRYEMELEILLIADADNPHLIEIPTDARVKILPSAPKPHDWMDKNWRLRQGVEHARFEDVLFLDSDVKVDADFLSLRSSLHQGDLSYCVPIYREAENTAEKFLAAFTSYNNFYLYRSSTAVMNIGTAVGPSVLITAGRSTLMQALEQTCGEVADDHALGHWFKKNGYTIDCISEPVYVAKTDAGWKEVLKQIKRWLILPRTIKHLLMPHSAFFFGVNVILNSASSLCFYAGVILGDLPIILTSLSLMMMEAGFLIYFETLYTKRLYSSYPWRHLLFVPTMLIVQPLLALQSLCTRKIEWRGGNYSTKPVRIK